MSNIHSDILIFDDPSSHRLANLCGPLNVNLSYFESIYDVKITHLNNKLKIEGAQKAHQEAIKAITHFYKIADNPILKKDLVLMVSNNQSSKKETSEVKIHTRNKTIMAKSKHQALFVKAIDKHVLNFATGPAGTGKTYLSVAKACEYLESAKVERLIFVRPAVEAGEKLGFLPGDMVEKVLPFLRPIYDALYELLGVETVDKYIERGIIEITPLAFMRGRTLNDAFIILDEAQNATISQMRMFLTRLGFGSKMVVTGDTTQTDLPMSQKSGLAHAVRLLENMKEVSINIFNAKDVVRHQLVSQIISAYGQESS